METQLIMLSEKIQFMYIKNNKLKQLITILVLLCPMLLLGQVKHEAKVNLLTRPDGYKLAYEFIPKKKLGFELGIGYLFEDTGLLSIDPEPVTFSFVDTEVIIFYLETKYYFLSKESEKIGEGFWGGLYTYHEIETYRDPNYSSKFQEINNTQYREKPYRRLDFGISTGYKFILKKHFIIEPTSGLSVDISDYTSSKHKDFASPTFTGMFFLNIGYRF